MQLSSEISLRSKRQAAEELAHWFKTYPGPDDLTTGKGFDSLVVCAANCLIAESGKEEFAEDDVTAFINGIIDMQLTSAALRLIQEGKIATTVIDGEIAFNSLTESDS